MAIDTPFPVRVVQAIGISSSLILSGTAVGLSIFTIPRILESPTPLLLKQWKNMFESGKAKSIPLAAFSAAAYFWLAYKEFVRVEGKGGVLGGKTGRYIVAASLMLGIVPYTLVFIGSTNAKLLRKVDETRSFKVTDEVSETDLGGETVHQLVDWWGVLNLIRGGILVVGGTVGLWTALT